MYKYRKESNIAIALHNNMDTNMDMDMECWSTWTVETLHTP